ncbi:hypothetical protein [Campylobacter sp. MG1]|uniref:hypothetical protein n=1 Tax=Campylobacter sp. MG1 TaxID=2976332 RepID=UPI00226D0D36|nr:hypothetical protein [Campylobacter sp. MG1]
MKKYILGLSMLCFCACANTQSTNKPVVQALNQCQNVIYTDVSLNKNLACTEDVYYKNETLLANINFTNLKSSEQKIKISIDWFDKNLHHINTGNLGKKEVTIFPNDIVYLQFPAPSSQARAYKIQVYKITK